MEYLAEVIEFSASVIVTWETVLVLSIAFVVMFFIGYKRFQKTQPQPQPKKKPPKQVKAKRRRNLFT